MAAARQRRSNVAILFLFFLAGREPGLEAAKSERTTTPATAIATPVPMPARQPASLILAHMTFYFSHYSSMNFLQPENQALRKETTLFLDVIANRATLPKAREQWILNSRFQSTTMFCRYRCVDFVCLSSTSELIVCQQQAILSNF